MLISHRVVRCDITFVRGASEEKHPKIISGNNRTIQFSSDDFNTYKNVLKSEKKEDREFFRVTETRWQSSSCLHLQDLVENKEKSQMSGACKQFY